MHGEQVYRGDVVWVAFDPAIGCEIRKCRPAVVVSADEDNGNTLNRIVIVVPLSSVPKSRSPRWDEVVIAPGQSGLPQPSITASNQLRAIDRQRIERRVGRVSDSELAAIERLLQGVLDLA